MADYLFSDPDPDAGTYQRTEDEAVRDEFRLIFESEREDEIQDSGEPTAENLDEMNHTVAECGPEFGL